MKDDDKELEIAEKVFGSVKKIKATGDHKVNLDVIKEPFNTSGYVLKLFCRGCGNYYDLSEAAAEIIAQLGCTSLAENRPEEYYVESEGCIYCDGNIRQVYFIKL